MPFLYQLYLKKAVLCKKKMYRKTEPRVKHLPLSNVTLEYPGSQDKKKKNRSFIQKMFYVEALRFKISLVSWLSLKIENKYGFETIISLNQVCKI